MLHQEHYPKTIDENSPEWINATIVEAEDLHDLYLKTGYSDLLRAPRETCLWLDPEGQCWKGDCHTIDAENIVEVLYGTDVLESVETDAADFLIDHGWVKLSATLMLQYYCESHMYGNITAAQARTIKDWCDYFSVPFNWFVPDELIDDLYSY